MATLVQQNANTTNDGTPDARAFSGNVTTGNLLVCTIEFRDLTATVTSVTGSTNGAYTLAAAPSTGGAIYYKENCTGGAETVTVVFSAPSNSTTYIQVSEWSGIATSSALDQSGAQTNTDSMTVDVPSISITGAGLVVVIASLGGNATKTDAAGYSKLGYTPADASRCYAAYKLATVAGMENPDFTIDVSYSSSVAIANFLNAAGGSSNGAAVYYYSQL